MAARALGTTVIAALLAVLFLSDGPSPRDFSHWLRVARTTAQHAHQVEDGSNMKLLLTSDLFDINDGGHLPEILQSMLNETTEHGRTAAIAVWLRDGRAGWTDAYDRFVEVDVPGMQRLTELGVTKHIGLWINRDCAPGGQTMILESDIVGNVSRAADVREVKQVLDTAAVLVVPGGEPFKLLRHLRQAPGSEVWAHARERIRRGELVYLARSAGTIIAGSNVDITGFMSGRTLEEARQHLGDPVDWMGLDLLPGDIALRPHYKPGSMLGAKSRHANNRGNWSDDDFISHVRAHHPGVLPLPITDGDYLVYHGGQVKFGNSPTWLAQGLGASA